MGRHRRKYTDEFKAAAVERLYAPGATQGSVAKELGITSTQLKTWRLEIEAFGSMEAKRRQKADAAELARLKKENKVSPRQNKRRMSMAVQISPVRAK
jgi:transposase-like protein